MVELDDQIAQSVTRERLKRAVEGYSFTGKDGSRVVVQGIGGGFRYCKLSNPLFDESGAISGEVRFADLAAHVFFTETGMPIPKLPSGKTPFIGVAKGTAYYLLFNGVLGDKRPDGGNVLTAAILDKLPSHDGPRVVYGEGCRLGSERLKREGVVFRQIPYEVKVS
ncbi:MAG TPA: hypothetical protein PL033_12560 [Candidatus Brocadiia bacterium]|nr:hypothetical protein [Candidatus Brocadiia bacterium]